MGKYILCLLLGALASPCHLPAQVVTNIAHLRTLEDTTWWLATDTTTLFQVEGVVTTWTNLTSTTAGNAFFYIQDGTSGIGVFVTGGAAIRPAAGDRVRVVGPLVSFSSFLEMSLSTNNPSHSVTTLSTGNPLPAAVLFNNFSLTNNLPYMEALEGSLITITNVYFTNAPGAVFGSGVNVGITNALGQKFILRVTAYVGDIVGKPVPTMSTRVTGVLSQNLGNTAPDRTAGYQILPTRYVDIATNAVVGPAIMTISPLVSGIAGTAYSQTLSNSTGTAPWVWSVVSGNLPAGLSLTATNGTISGTPAAPGSSFFRARVTDSLGLYAEKDFALTIYCPNAKSPALSILTYNVNGNSATDWTTNAVQVQAIGRQVMYLQPDIITFNEIPVPYSYEMTNFVKAYLPGYYLATNSLGDGFIMSAIASRHPITRSTSWLNGSSLAAFGDSSTYVRDLFEAQISVPGFLQPLHVFTAHLKAMGDSASAQRRSAQAGAISNYFASGFLTTNASHPYVLTGDLNEDITQPASANPPIQRLANAATGLQFNTPVNPYTGSAFTESIRGPLDIRFDYILPGGLMFSNIVSSQVFRSDLLPSPPPPLLAGDNSTASDHLPVLMIFSNPFTPTLGAPAFSSGAMRFTVSGAAGTAYIVQTATSLGGAWTPVLTNTAPFPYADTNNGAPSQKFYRAVSAP